MRPRNTTAEQNTVNAIRILLTYSSVFTTFSHGISTVAIGVKCKTKVTPVRYLKKYDAILFLEVVSIDTSGKHFGLYGDKNLTSTPTFAVYFDLKTKEANLFSLPVMAISKGRNSKFRFPLIGYL